MERLGDLFLFLRSMNTLRWQQAPTWFMMCNFMGIWLVHILWLDRTLTFLWVLTDSTSHSVCFFLCYGEKHLLCFSVCRCSSCHVSIVKRFTLDCWFHFGIQRLRRTTHALTSNSYKLQVSVAQLFFYIWKELVLVSFLGIQKGLDSTAKLVAVDHAYGWSSSSGLVLFYTSWQI